jgi:phage terminase small subunit
MTTRQPFTPQEEAALTDGSGRAIHLPAVAATLRPRQIMFARLVAAGFSYVASAKMAGYAYKTEASARNHGSELASDPRIAELVRTFTAALLKSTAPTALATLSKVMASATAKDSDKVRAASKVIDKVVPTLSHHESAGHLRVEHDHRIEASGPTLAELYRRAGKEPPAHLLKAPALSVIDAEWEDVTPDVEEVWAVE